MTEHCMSSPATGRLSSTHFTACYNALTHPTTATRLGVHTSYLQLLWASGCKKPAQTDRRYTNLITEERQLHRKNKYAITVVCYREVLLSPSVGGMVTIDEILKHVDAPIFHVVLPGRMSTKNERSVTIHVQVSCSHLHVSWILP